jgi:hypothetical protein
MESFNENVSTGNSRRAKFGSIKQRVGSSEVVSNRDVANAAQKSTDAKKSAGDAAHAAATKAGKSPMEAETARNRAHREYEKAQKKARLNNSYIPSFSEFISEASEKDHEVSMAQSQLDSAAKNIKTLKKNLGKKEKNIPAWMQAKITDTAHNMDAVATYKEGAAWTKKEGQNQSGGLNEKGRKSYEEENPGSDLKAPSKKVGNPRRTSFCARMRGMKQKLTSRKTANDPDSRINKSLRAWNC